MDPVVTDVLAATVLAVVMLGLGLAVDTSHVRRLRSQPTVVIHVLVCQVLLLPLVCLGMIEVFELPSTLAVGMMLVAASPGGPGANLLSRLFGGDVSLSVPLTALNTVVAALTMPLVTGAALHELGRTDMLNASAILPAYVLVFVPMVCGITIAARWPHAAGPLAVRVSGVAPLLLGAVALAVLFAERAGDAGHLGRVVAAAVLFCGASLVVGFAVPRLAGVTDDVSIAAGFGVGLNNATLAIFVAVWVLGSTEAAVSAAVYGLVMFALAGCWGLLLTRIIEPRREPAAPRATAADR